MFLVDANVLIYAVNSDATHHRACQRWLANACDGDESVGLPWLSLLAFVRIVTHPRILARPVPIADACAIVRAWLSVPVTSVPAPGAEHWHYLEALLAGHDTRGNLASDAHLAAMALEMGATVVTCDMDFQRFSGIRTLDPRF